jgi:hypothetical protein
MYISVKVTFENLTFEWRFFDPMDQVRHSSFWYFIRPFFTLYFSGEFPLKSTRSLLAALLLALPLSVFAFGAIAVDDEQGESAPGYGVATDMDSKAEATAAAMKQCRAAGNKNCKVAVWFETCGAYAGSRKYFGIGYGKTKKAAESAAVSECGNSACKVVVSECE